MMESDKNVEFQECHYTTLVDNCKSTKSVELLSGRMLIVSVVAES